MKVKKTKQIVDPFDLIEKNKKGIRSIQEYYYKL